MTTSGTGTLSKLHRAIEALRDHDPEMQANTIQVFLLVALDKSGEGVAMQDLEKKVNCSQAALSRSVAALTDMTYLRKPGPGLVVRFEDPMNRRTKLVKLSAKGKRLAETIKTALE